MINNTEFIESALEITRLRERPVCMVANDNNYLCCNMSDNMVIQIGQTSLRSEVIRKSREHVTVYKAIINSHP